MAISQRLAMLRSTISAVSIIITRSSGRDFILRWLRFQTSLIEKIRQKVADEQFEFSKHAVDQSILRQVQVQEVREVIANGQVIEDYPNDKYGPSCLISGLTQARRPIHIQCSYPSRPLVRIITLYQPDPQKWNEDFTQRRNRGDDS